MSCVFHFPHNIHFFFYLKTDSTDSYDTSTVSSEHTVLKNIFSVQYIRLAYECTLF